MFNYKIINEMENLTKKYKKSMKAAFKDIHRHIELTYNIPVRSLSRSNRFVLQSSVCNDETHRLNRELGIV